MSRPLPIFLGIFVFITSIILGIHNATWYHPSHGFDGVGHLEYINYIARYWSLPPPKFGWETHQAPLYYVVGAIVKNLFGQPKAVQYLNIFFFWLLVGVVAIGLRKILTHPDQVLIGTFALVALPMLNIFPPMLSNELLGAVFSVSVVIGCLFLLMAKNRSEYLHSLVWITACFILGFWTKVSITIVLPTVFVTLYLNKPPLVPALVSLFLVVVFCVPIYWRGAQSEGPSNLGSVITEKIVPLPPDFYYRFDWLPKVDMYNAQYYSLTGGAWNSFWTDGQNAITPFVHFHKKSLILWLLGFVLLPISISGLIKLYREKRDTATVLATLGISMLGTYVFYNFLSHHYSAARLTYEMPIVVPYAFGLAFAAGERRFKRLLIVLLLLQFLTMVSFFWIEPWWHVVRPA